VEGAASEEARRELAHILAWSEKVNRAVKEIVQGIPPFPYVRGSLVKLQDRADVVVVSATPIEALKREWQEHDVARYTALICGQEMGTKTEHIASIAGGYAENHVLMIGDAPGDRMAAMANDALFYPIIPSDEEISWKDFINEVMELFFSEGYAGRYEANLSERFERALPDSPPWEVIT
ncbi:MAG: HAD family hydrolase, partial [Candidatus Bipolaricaulota bacterium]|nr:HAD family hydrolase [Candidatus Bipolaricaulota bacterium]